MALHGYRPRSWRHTVRWVPVSGEGPLITTALNYDGGEVVRLKVCIEEGREEEMRGDQRLQAAISEARNRAERRCTRDEVTVGLRVTVIDHETESSTGTETREEQHNERDSGGESEMSEADRETDLRPVYRTAHQFNGRIDHVINLIGDIGVFNGPDTISSTVAAIKTDITKLQTRPDTATKTYKMPHFDISKFDDYNKSDASTWWQRFLTEASCRTVPADDMMKALYLQLIGGVQAWMNHLAATKKCTIAELHTHIPWKEFEKLWLTRFMVLNVVKAAMNEVYTSSQGSMPTRDWTTKWQKIVTTPGLDLSFTNQRSKFFSRSCAALRSALGNEYDYDSFQAILDRANLVIQTDDKAANERQSQPHYVAKQGYQRPTHNNAVISEETVDLHTAAASSSDGGIVAALPPKRPKRGRKNKATQETASTRTGQQPWMAYKITKDVYDLRQKTVPDRPIRHGITLEDGVIPPRGCIYRMSKEELEVLRAQLDDLLDKGWIRPSCSPYGAPVLFVRKKNKDLRLCIDCRKLNAQTVKNVGPLTWIDDLLERLGGATYFSKLDLKSGYHQIEIQPQNRYKTAFKTQYGHFEWVVMPFGLTNAPATFQAAMTTKFRDLLDLSVLIYLDDILVYSRTLDEHITHLRAVLNRLRLAKYKANRDKCEFAKQELEYLGHYVTPKGIRPLADKIQAIVDWPEPRCTTDVRSFMGLAGYYQRFLESYSKVAAPLSRLQSPKVPFEFDDAAHGAFTTLKAAMQAAPALRIYDPTIPTQGTTDASGYDRGRRSPREEGTASSEEAEEGRQAVPAGSARDVVEEAVVEEEMTNDDDDFEDDDGEPLQRKARVSSAEGVRINEGGEGTPTARRGGGVAAANQPVFVDVARDVARDMARRDVGGRAKEGAASHETAQCMLAPLNRPRTPAADVAGSSQAAVEGGTLRSPAVAARGGAVAIPGEAVEVPKGGDGAAPGEDGEALVHRLRGQRAATHAMDAAAKLWEDDNRFWNNTQGSAIVRIIQEARAYLVAVARGVQPPAIRRSISLPHNSIPQHKIEDESELNAAKERALKVQTISLRAIHGWVFKSESRQRGYHLAYQYALNHAATDIARAMWLAEDWRSLVSPMLFHTTLDVDMKLPLWFVGVNIVDRHEDDECAAYQEACVERLVRDFISAVGTAEAMDGGRVSYECLKGMAEAMRYLLTATMWIMQMAGDDSRSHYDAWVFVQQTAKTTLLASMNRQFDARRHITQSAQVMTDKLGRPPPTFAPPPAYISDWASKCGVTFSHDATLASPMEAKQLDQLGTGPPGDDDDDAEGDDKGKGG
ncbi:hypothetical protein CBR_g40565 [Chara braunii]|uniref:Reverse transcriptase domain-containing protein n=1 Tax=Chara braunii TaxID=69332 RepID=A0A388K261_CHABU|nr:hypothetical protein CBR_g40565 [Chara braunii]|eukprot:GBG64117.1 hypothetical protein CBR_g40565 [Chara braunii]